LLADEIKKLKAGWSTPVVEGDQDAVLATVLCKYLARFDLDWQSVKQEVASR
jgi:sigma54-dependent transcription regulator